MSEQSNKLKAVLEDGYITLISGDSQRVRTMYRKLELVPRNVFGYADVYIGRKDIGSDLVQFKRNFESAKINCVVWNCDDVFATKKGMPISEVAIQGGGLCIQVDTADGRLIGYVKHPEFGTYLPNYSSMEIRTYDIDKTRLPKSMLQVDRVDECTVAIVTKKVEGKTKKGLLIRKMIWSEPEKCFVPHKWQILENCIHDEIIEGESGNFYFKNYKTIKGEICHQCGFLRCSAYYNIVFDEKGARHAYPTFQREIWLANIFADFPRTLDVKAADESGWYEELILAEKSTKHTLFKARYRWIRSNALDLRGLGEDSHLEKMLDSDFDSIASLHLGIPNRKGLIDTFEIRKKDKVGLLFDCKDEAGKYLRTNCVYSDVSKFIIANGKVIHILTDFDGCMSMICVDVVGQPNIKKDESVKYRFLKTSPIYKKIEDMRGRGIPVLIATRKDGKLDIFSLNFSLVAFDVASFEAKGGYFITQRPYKTGTETKIFDDQFRPVYTFYGTNVLSFYVETYDMLILKVDDIIAVVSQNQVEILDRKCESIRVFNEHVITSDEKGFRILKICSDGLKPLFETCFSSVELLLDETRAIVSFRNSGGKVVYGVLNMTVRCACVEFKYEEIVWDGTYFVCRMGEKIDVFDGNGLPVTTMEPASTSKSLQLQPIKHQQ